LTPYRPVNTSPERRRPALEERFGLLVDREAATRDNRGLARRPRNARLKQQAALEDLDYKHPRNRGGKLVRSLASLEWVKERLSLTITGPTGVGKTYIACAFAHQACRLGVTSLM
jgi:DNA replication protein DnaC